MALSNLNGWKKYLSATAVSCGTACGASDKPEEKPAAPLAARPTGSNSVAGGDCNCTLARPKQPQSPLTAKEIMTEAGGEQHEELFFIPVAHHR